MIKYEILIDGENYKALFTDHFEASDFLDANEEDGSEVIVVGYKEVSASDILADKDFEYPYKIENIALLTMPDAKNFKKWFELEFELKDRGII